ncbi:MAG: CsiV family protein [Halioglobus sp.]
MIKPLPQLTAAIAGLLLSGACLAQDERWFKVEVMIFSQRSEAAAAAERWQPTPILQYPGESRFLLDPQRISENAEMYEGQSVVDEFGRQIITLDNPLDEDIDPALAEPEDIKQALAENTGIDESQLDEPPTETVQRVTPTPFTRLGSDAREFNSRASRMQRTGRYDILFHEAWVQAVAPKNEALPIVVDRSGDNQTWPQLQGSIKLYLSRYLHIETNLWLNTMGQYLPQNWKIPAPPLGPLSLIIEEPEIPLEALIAAENVAIPPVEELPGESPENAEIIEPLSIDPGPVYPWRHAILLQQKRKMRSTEVHYIDHPMLGVVALITPLSEDDLAAMATAEFVTDSNQPLK